MEFMLVKGKDFSEEFNFKTASGKSVALPNGRFSLVLERGTFAREYTVANDGLSRLRNKVTWRIPAEQSADFAYNVMYYTLYLDDTELARGILRIQ